MKSDNILISSARSGTNFLLSVYKRMRPHDFVAKEIFRTSGDSLDLQCDLLGISEEDALALLRTDPLAMWKRIVMECEAKGNAAFAKIFYYHQPADAPLWGHFARSSRVVHLIRRNQFDVLVSHQVAQRTGQWQKFINKSAEFEVPKFEITPSQIEAHMQSAKSSVERIRSNFAAADYHELFYEDISASPEHCAEALSAIFGIEMPESSEVGIRKQKTTSNSDLISNYEDVKVYDRPFF